ncbi:competence protein CoiA family protein [Streptodolium elevatio]
MANGVWHAQRKISINLTRSDLGHPEVEGLLEEITAGVAERDPRMLECMSHHLYGVCGSERVGKSHWMFIRRGRTGGRLRWVAAHLPATHRATPEESNRHRATKERIAAAAAARGLDVEVEARTSDGHGVLDALVTGPGGIRVGWEVQYAPVSAGSVRRRSETTVRNGAIPSWVTHDARSEVIDRAPWARIDDMPWQDIANGRELMVRSGVRHLQMWRCTPRSDWTCPYHRGTCGAWHHAWMAPAQCRPAKDNTTIDELVVSTACGEHVPHFIRSRGRGRSGFHMWVAPKELDAWRGLEGIEDAEPGQDGGDEAEEIDYPDEDIDLDCHWGERAIHRNGAGPLRDLADPHAPFRAATDSTPRSGTVDLDRFRLSDAERRAAAVLLDCPGWEVGPCAGCGDSMHRYGRNAGMYCATCRWIRNPA